MENPELSVIIPTLNESHSIAVLLDDLGRQRGLRFELIVGDGGSTDNTINLVKAWGGRVMRAPKGRGAQLNAAVTMARADWFLFLHADSRIPSETLLSDALLYLQDEVQRNGSHQVAGHFGLQFLRRHGGHDMAYRYVEEKTRFNRVNTTNGDQGFLMSRQYFSELGGFDDSLPFLEDQKLAEKIRSQGHWVLLPGFLQTSARRFEVEGFHRRYILMGIIMGLHSTGAESFFKRAPAVYKEQDKTGSLKLWPFFKILWVMQVKDMGLKGSVKAWYRVGEYVRQNSWQMFYFFDIWMRSWLGPGRYPFLRFHDQVFYPLTNNAVCSAINGCLVFVWFMMILGPYFFFVDSRQAPPGKNKASHMGEA